MTETGVVLRVDGDMTEISFVRTSACAKCGRCGLLSETGEATLRLKTSENLAPGDSVTVDLPEQTLFQASLLAYGIPLVTMLAGLFLGAFVQTHFNLTLSRDIAAAIGALFFTAAAFGLLRLLNPRFALHNHFAPRIVGIRPAEDTENNCAPSHSNPTKEA